MIKLSKAEIAERLGNFIWSFKIGDNVVYNFKILFALYEAKEASKTPDVFNKPIVMQLVSIIEALFIDFLYRIDEASSHLPSNIEPNILKDLKEKITKEKKRVVKKDELLGESVYFKKREYRFMELIKLFNEKGLLGGKGTNLNEYLQGICYLRNRVHIQNYHNNFEKNESIVFKEARLEKAEKVLTYLLNYFFKNYSRPLYEGTIKDNIKNWLYIMS